MAMVTLTRLTRLAYTILRDRSLLTGRAGLQKKKIASYTQDMIEPFAPFLFEDNRSIIDLELRLS